MFKNNGQSNEFFTIQNDNQAQCTATNPRATYQTNDRETSTSVVATVHGETNQSSSQLHEMGYRGIGLQPENENILMEKEKCIASLVCLVAAPQDYVVEELNLQDCQINLESSSLLNSTSIDGACSSKTIQAENTTTTLKPSLQNQDNSLQWWEAHLASKPAYPIPTAQVLKEFLQDYGGNISESSKNVDPQSFFGKILQDVDTQLPITNYLHWDKYCGRLTPAGMSVSGNQYELVMLGRLTNVIGSLSLATDKTCTQESTSHFGIDKSQKLLPTPLASHRGSGRTNKGRQILDKVLTPETMQYVLHPNIQEWMMGLPKDCTILDTQDGGAKTRLKGIHRRLPVPSKTEATESACLEMPAPLSNPPSVGDISTTSQEFSKQNYGNSATGYLYQRKKGNRLIWEFRYQRKNYYVGIGKWAPVLRAIQEGKDGQEVLAILKKRTNKCLI